jgi:hypothetical protein
MWMQQQANQQPWQQSGAGAVNMLSHMMGIDPYTATNGPYNQGQDPYAQYAGMDQQQIAALLQSQQPQQQQPQNALVAGGAWGGANEYGRSRNQMSQQPQQNGNFDAQAAAIMQAMQNQQTQQNQPQQQFDPATRGSLMKNFSMADYQADPGYSFRLKEGMKNLEQGAAARGGLLSGNMLRGAQDYGQGAASQEYQNAYNRFNSNQTNQYNRLAGLAGSGQTANNALGQAGQNYANNAGNIGMDNAANQGNAQMAAGQARASSLQGIGTAIGGVNWGNVFGGGSPSNYTSNIGAFGGYGSTSGPYASSMNAGSPGGTGQDFSMFGKKFA